MYLSVFCFPFEERVIKIVHDLNLNHLKKHTLNKKNLKHNELVPSITVYSSLKRFCNNYLKSHFSLHIPITAEAWCVAERANKLPKYRQVIKNFSTTCLYIHFYLWLLLPGNPGFWNMYLTASIKPTKTALQKSNSERTQIPHLHACTSTLQARYMNSEKRNNHFLENSKYNFYSQDTNMNVSTCLSEKAHTH